MKGRTREAGGLAGSGARALPVRRIEWAALALAFGLGAGLAWPRRWVVAACTVGLAACAVAVPLHAELVARRAEAVVMHDVKLGGSDIDLEPGRVVRVSSTGNGRSHVWVGPGVEGWVPDDALRAVGSLP
jgi:hypothetical protein